MKVLFSFLSEQLWRQVHEAVRRPNRRTEDRYKCPSWYYYLSCRLTIYHTLPPAWAPETLLEASLHEPLNLCNIPAGITQMSLLLPPYVWLLYPYFLRILKSLQLQQFPMSEQNQGNQKIKTHHKYEHYLLRQLTANTTELALISFKDN